MQAIRGVLFGDDPVSSDDVKLSLSTYDSWLSGEFLTKVMVREFRDRSAILDDAEVEMEFIGADFVTNINPGAFWEDNEVPGFRKEGAIHVMPVHVNGDHWVLMAVTIGEGRKLIEIWDSSDLKKSEEFSSRYITEISKLQWWFDGGHFQTETRSTPGWRVVFRDSEKQDNNYDCGVWVYKNFLALMKRELDRNNEEVPVRMEDLSPKEVRRNWRLRYRYLMPLYDCVFREKDIPPVLNFDARIKLAKSALKTSDDIDVLQKNIAEIYDDFKKQATRGLKALNMSFISSEEDITRHSFFNLKVLAEFDGDFLQGAATIAKKRFQAVEKFVISYNKLLEDFDTLLDALEEKQIKKKVSYIKDLETPPPIGVPAPPTEVDLLRPSVSPQKRGKSPVPPPLGFVGGPKGVKLVGQPEGTTREPVKEPPRPEKVFRSWPANDLDIDEKLKAIEEWVRYQTGEESNKKMKSRAEIEDLVFESSGMKRDLDDDDEVLEIKIDGSTLEKDPSNLWVNRPEIGGQYEVRIVDDNSRLNRSNANYVTSLEQIKRTRAILDKNRRSRPPYIRSSIISIVSNDAFRVLVLSDETIYDNEVGLPPKYKVNQRGELVPAKRYTPEYKRENGTNASWDSLVLSHNEAIVVASRFNSYYALLALIKLYLDRRSISKQNGWE